MILIENYTKLFGRRTLIENCNIRFDNTGFYCILGKSGCGKTTLLNCILGLDSNYDGEIFINGENLKYKSENEKRDFRVNNFGIVFQTFCLFENQTVLENLNMFLNSSFGLDKESINQKINDTLQFLNILELKNDYVRNLSGGEKQRVAIARCLLNDSDIILCDEPTGSLDEINSIQVFEILKELSKTKLVIVVTHDQELANEFADYIFNFRKNSLVINNSKKIPSKHFETIKKACYGIASLPIRNIFSIVKSSYKFKKARYYISSIILSISLICFGVSLFISENVNRSINKAFSNLINENSLILRKKNQGNEMIRYGASLEEISTMAVDYSGDVEYIGATYLNNFSDFFIDENCFYSSKDSFLKELSFLKIQNIINFRKIDFNLYEEYGIKSLENDQIILDLDYVSMEKLCLNLEIVRSYESINAYIRNQGLNIILRVANYNRNYEDEIIFKVVGIRKNSYINILHTNSLFNEFILEEVMRFPYTQYVDAKAEVPWLLYKLYYIKTKTFQATFLNSISKDEKYYKFIFDSDSAFYSPQNCMIGEQCYSNKIFVYRTIDRNINLAIIEAIKKMNNKFTNYYFSTPYGYFNYGDGIFNGFTLETYFSLSELDMNSAIKSLESIEKEKYDNIQFDKILKGHILNTSSTNVKYSTIYDGEYKGKDTLNFNEIAISSSMASYFGEKNIIGKDIFLFHIYEQNENEKKIFNKFKHIKLKIGGIVDSNKFSIYQKGDFSLSLFRDFFQISSFNLIPNSIVYEFKQKPSNEEINKINRAFPEYEIIDPFASINKTINETFSYLNIALTIFTIFSSLSSIILLFVINTINFEEDKNEIKFLEILGFRNYEVNKMQLIKIFSFVLPSTILSCFSMFLISFTLNGTLTKSLGLSIEYNVPLFSLIGILALSVIITIFSFMPQILKSKSR